VIEVRIDAVVLDGFAPAAGDRLGPELERALADLMGREGGPPAGDGPASQIARAIHTEVTRCTT
jgi:hypothetical protein